MNRNAAQWQSPSRVSPRTAFGAWLCFGLAVLISWYNWSPLLDARWSIIDDHEIVSVIGSRERLPVPEIPAALQKTEVGDSGVAVRFRPSYYGIRFLEAATWGKQPQLWYAARIFVFLFFALVLAAICLRLGGPVLTGVFLIFELSRPYWADIFARLGPAENYAVFGSSLIAYGFYALARNGSLKLPYLAIASGIVIAAGSKENFVILAIVPLWLLFSPGVRLSPGLRFVFGAVLAYVAWISIEVISRLLHTGHDVYAQSVSIGSRLGLLKSLATRLDVLVWLGICASLFLLTLVWTRRDEAVRHSMLRVRRHAWAMLALLAVFASQFVFYFGQWPIGAVPRYLFPGILAQHLAIFLFVVVIAEIFAARPSRSRRHAWILYLIAALYFVKPSVTDLGANRAASRQTVATTIAFTGRLNESVTYLKAHPAAALILNSNNVIDYEPVYSIERFVRASGVRNPIALHLNGYSAGSYSDTGSTKLSFMLATALEQIQLEGDGKFVPLRSTITFPECFSIGLSGAALARCQAGITISP